MPAVTGARPRVAVVQAASVAFDLDATLSKLETLAAQAAARGARLVLFPEAFVGGYPRGLSFGATVGNRTAEGREEFRMYWEAAIDVPGAATAPWRARPRLSSLPMADSSSSV